MSVLLHISETLDTLFWKPKKSNVVKSNVVLFFYSATHLDRLDIHCENLCRKVFDISIDVMCDTSQIDKAQHKRETICFLRENQSVSLKGNYH